MLRESESKKVRDRGCGVEQFLFSLSSQGGASLLRTRVPPNWSEEMVYSKEVLGLCAKACARSWEVDTLLVLWLPQGCMDALERA